MFVASSIEDKHSFGDHDSCKSAVNNREWMTRLTNDPIVERARRLAERLRKREAYQKAAELIRQDRSFPTEIRRVADESLRLQNQ